jgi:hypothetical protein
MSVLPYFASATLAMKPFALGLTLRAIWLMRSVIMKLRILIMGLRLITGEMTLGNIATAEDFHYTANPFRR